MPVSNEGFKLDEDILVPDEFKPYRDYLNLMIRLFTKEMSDGEVMKWRR